MTTCDLCWEGRHARCGGRNGCTCGVCSGSDRPKHHVRQEQRSKPKLAIPNPYKGAKGFHTPDPSRAFTVDDFRIAREVLQDLPSLFERERVRRNLAFERVGDECALGEQSLRKMVKGQLTQGLTTRSVLALLAWMEQSPSRPCEPLWEPTGPQVAEPTE